MNGSGARIELVGDRSVRMAPGLYMWCKLIEFAIVDARVDDRDLLASVITHRRYRDHCAGAFAAQDHHDLHGPYRIECITVGGFAQSSAADALQILYAWPGTDLAPQHAGSMVLSQEIIGAWVAPILAHADAIYQLALPRQGNEHDWGWVVGGSGFHEYMAIDRADRAITLIIASDD